MQTEEKHNGMTAGNVAGIAIAAYAGAKVFRALGSVAVTTISFRRARKADQAQEQ